MAKRRLKPQGGDKPLEAKRSETIADKLSLSADRRDETRTGRLKPSGTKPCCVFLNSSLTLTVLVEVLDLGDF